MVLIKLDVLSRDVPIHECLCENTSPPLSEVYKSMPWTPPVFGIGELA